MHQLTPLAPKKGFKVLGSVETIANVAAYLMKFILLFSDVNDASDCLDHLSNRMISRLTALLVELCATRPMETELLFRPPTSSCLDVAQQAHNFLQGGLGSLDQGFVLVSLFSSIFNRFLSIDAIRNEPTW